MTVPEYIYSEGLKQGCTKEALCALLAQIQEESAFSNMNLEDTANRKLGISDQEYVRRVDNGQYTNFVNDGFGFGLFQVTFYTRKRQFLNWMKARNLSIGDLAGQVAFIWWELQHDFSVIWREMKTSKDLYALTKKLLYQWENPSEKENNLVRRYGYAQKWYKQVDSFETDGGIKMTKVEQYVQEAVAIANDKRHGYSQTSRWGPDYDCSSLVITVVQNAGIPVKSRGAASTRNMRSVFLSCGFVDVTGSCNLITGAGMQRGDILLNDINHTAIHLGSGKIVHARSDDGSPLTGDQSGNEIRTQNYWNYPWNAVLRYNGDNSASVSYTIPSGPSASSSASGNLRIGSRGDEVKKLQENLMKLGYDLGKWGADGSFGSSTYNAVKQFQEDHKLLKDGIVGPATSSAIETAVAELKKDSSASGNTGASAKSISVGDIVNFTGSKHYTAANFDTCFPCQPGQAKVTQIFKGSKHPYHLIRVMGGTSTVYGWVDESDIES